MILSDAEFHEASTLHHASELLARLGPGAHLMMGGTDLLVDLKKGRLQASHIVSLGRVASLKDIVVDDDGVRIGAAATLSQLLHSKVIRERFPALIETTLEMAAPQIRNVATMGGNIASAVPSADLPPTLMVMKARVTLWSRAGERVLPLEDFFTGPRQTARRGDELLTAIFIPYPPARFGAAYARFALREANAIAVAAVAAGVVLGEDGRVREARIGLCAVAPTPILVDAGTLLAGRKLDKVSVGRAAAAAMEASRPISDMRGQADFRRALVDALTRRALVSAGTRAQENGSAAVQ